MKPRPAGNFLLRKKHHFFRFWRQEHEAEAAKSIENQKEEYRTFEISGRKEVRILIVSGYMARFILLITAIALTSCVDSRVKMYEGIVRDADRFEIYYKATNKTVTVPERLTANFKDILIRNVSSETQRKFINDAKIAIYKGSKQTAFLMITNSGKSPFVNFNSDKLNFGFRLTYGIGQTIDNLYYDNSR